MTETGYLYSKEPTAANLTIPKKTWVILADPEWDDILETVMEFRLTYEGPLQASTGNQPRSRNKHQLRRVFHPQLKRLWEEHPVLKNRPAENGTHDSLAESLAKNFSRCGYNFVPLVNKGLWLTCGLDILFLRPESPGQVLKSGDIDNRLKTLFDALRMPHSRGELGGYEAPNDDEQPFYCLLEDDSLVSKVTVDTDTLLEDVKDERGKNLGFKDAAARLVITVTVKTYFPTRHNIGLG